MSNDSLPPGPRSADAEVEAGRALLGAGQVGEAAAAFQRALHTDPGHYSAHMGMASLLTGAQRFAEAERHAREALAARAYAPDAVRTLAALLQLQGRHDQALAYAQSVTAARPDHGEGWMALGDSLANLGRQDEALAAYGTAMGDGTLAFLALVRTGLMLGALGRGEAAIAAFDKAIAMDPQAAEPRHQRGLLRLAMQDFAAGWDDWEARWRSERFVAAARGIVPRPIVPMLAVGPSAESLAGKRVLLMGEQGVGDQIMFASMIPDLARIAASVECVCEPRLVRLLSASFDGVSVLEPKDAKIDTDVIDVLLAMGSLGSAFRRDARNFPGTPYLRPRDAVREHWAERLGPKTRRLRIGVSWRGGVAATRTHARSLSLDQLAPVLDLADCEFVSLQYGDVAAEVASFNAGRDNPLRIFPRAEIDDFEDLAGLVANLDLVVSVQTTLVHLCGAIGQTCLTLVPHTPEWRDGAQGPTMPWYRSVRLFRQARHGAWDRVIAEVAAEVPARLTTP
jgi:Flp pilus assembly protein TadD/ADP-heptose:LPS heptosyltransferase